MFDSQKERKVVKIDLLVYEAVLGICFLRIINQIILYRNRNFVDDLSKSLDFSNLGFSDLEQDSNLTLARKIYLISYSHPHSILFQIEQQNEVQGQVSLTNDRSQKQDSQILIVNVINARQEYLWTKGNEAQEIATH